MCLDLMLLNVHQKGYNIFVNWILLCTSFLYSLVDNKLNTEENIKGAPRWRSDDASDEEDDRDVGRAMDIAYYSTPPTQMTRRSRVSRRWKLNFLVKGFWKFMWRNKKIRMLKGCFWNESFAFLELGSFNAGVCCAANIQWRKF